MIGVCKIFRKDQVLCIYFFKNTVKQWYYVVLQQLKKINFKNFYFKIQFIPLMANAVITPSLQCDTSLQKLF